MVRMRATYERTTRTSSFQRRPPSLARRAQPEARRADRSTTRESSEQRGILIASTERGDVAETQIEQEAALRIGAFDATLLADVERALKKLDDGHYGTSEESGANSRSSGSTRCHGRDEPPPKSNAVDNDMIGSASSVTASRIFITGSADGLGLMAGRLLAEQGHRVTLHARNDARAADARRALPAAEAVVVGDPVQHRRHASCRRASERVRPVRCGIHNAAIGYREPRRVETADGIEAVFAINVLAPYLLTALVGRPHRLIYLSSGLHRSGDPDSPIRNGSGAGGTEPRRTPTASCSDVVPCSRSARHPPDLLANALERVLVATKMGGQGEPD